MAASTGSTKRECSMAAPRLLQFLQLQELQFLQLLESSSSLHMHPLPTLGSMNSVNSKTIGVVGRMIQQEVPCTDTLMGVVVMTLVLNLIFICLGFVFNRSIS